MGTWSGLYPPQAIFANRQFRKVLLDPPNFEPGSWCGAGSMWLDEDTEEYWLSSRPRMKPEKRGYAVEIYRATDGENFNLVNRITKEELSEVIGRKVLSIENQQLIRDPLTGLYHLYLSVDVVVKEGDKEQGIRSKWETLLLITDDPTSSWEPYGFVLRCDRDYDFYEARDCTIGIVDGRYFCLYKARSKSNVVNTALAISNDGKNWIKLGVPTIDGKPQPKYLLLSGSIYGGSLGPIFIGTETHTVIKGAALTKHFTAYVIDYKNINLERLFIEEWEPLSMFEHPEYPIHTYCDITYDSLRDLWLITVEAIDPNYTKELGLNTEVDRLLLYTSF